MVLGTYKEDGSIQMTPVWFEYDEKENVFRFSTTGNRVKYKNLTRDPRCTFVIYDLENPYQYIQVRGKVTDYTREGGHDFIDKLTKRYMGKDKYPGDPERKEDRVTFTITPEHYSTQGF